jgi:hypothetical protein
VAGGEVVLVIVEDELVTVLVDGIVGEMHAHVLEVAVVGRHVLFGG